MMIPIVFITDENFIMQTGVAIYSLAESKNTDTEYKVYIIMAECSEEGKRRIQKAECSGVNITIIEASLDKYRDIKQLAHIPIACLLKFNICDLVSDQDKLIYLDGDILIRGDLTALYNYDLEENILAGVPSLDMIYEKKKLVNAGILLFDAKKMRDEHMADKLIAQRRSLGDRGSMDQQTFNLMLSNRMGFLPFVYNVIPNKILGDEKKEYTVSKLNELYGVSYLKKKDMANDAVIWHYATGGKPWKYSFVPCADEWYQCYLKSPYGEQKLQRKSAFQAHMEGIRRNLKEGGFRAVAKRAMYYIKVMMGKNHYSGWG